MVSPRGLVLEGGHPTTLQRQTTQGLKDAVLAGLN